MACGGVGVALWIPAPAFATLGCDRGKASETRVGGVAGTVAWRAGLMRRTSLFRGLPRGGAGRLGAIAPRQAPWLLILRAARDRDGRCWLKVRLPSRPNNASGWLAADRVLLRATTWSLAISRVRRTLTVRRGGVVVRRAKVVVGAAGTPTPRGLFSIVGAWRSAPSGFLGSWILPLSAHSNVLQEFGGGDGRVGIHGRGGASLLDPLGSAASHGCIRLANDTIEWLARSVGPRKLAGVPVRVR